jgi:hypothetical protein
MPGGDPLPLKCEMRFAPRKGWTAKIYVEAPPALYNDWLCHLLTRQSATDFRTRPGDLSIFPAIRHPETDLP